MRTIPEERTAMPSQAILIRQRVPDPGEARRVQTEDIALGHGCSFGLDRDGWYLEGSRERIRSALWELNDERIFAVFGRGKVELP